MHHQPCRRRYASLSNCRKRIPYIKRPRQQQQDNTHANELLFSVVLAITETGTAKATKERRLSSNLTRSLLLSKEVDVREGKQVTSRGVGGGASSRARRDRVSPESGGGATTKMASKAAASLPVDNGESRRSFRTNSKTANSALLVSTKWDPNDDCNFPTPRTEASTPSPPSSPVASSSVRNQTDLRSPGQRKSPKVAASSEDAPLPDFMTQTDKFGNAVTPRTATAIQQARVEHPSGALPHLHLDNKTGKLTEEQDSVDVCTETLLDSLRIMCCCRLPEDATEKSSSTKDSDDHADGRPRLLPKLHADDRGKKCLVLDLDETLVHSSFRAVTGADFVIPVQVRSCVCR